MRITYEILSYLPNKKLLVTKDDENPTLRRGNRGRLACNVVFLKSWK